MTTSNDALFLNAIESGQRVLIIEECPDIDQLSVVSEEVMDEIMSALPEDVRDEVRDRRCIVVGGPRISLVGAGMLVLGVSGLTGREIVSDGAQRGAERLLEEAVKAYMPPTEQKKKAQWLEDRYHPFRKRGLIR